MAIRILKLVYTVSIKSIRGCVDRRMTTLRAPDLFVVHVMLRSHGLGTGPHEVDRGVTRIIVKAFLTMVAKQSSVYFSAVDK